MIASTCAMRDARCAMYAMSPEPIGEDAPLAPTSPYAASKLAAADGGVPVRWGDVVLGDDNGVLVVRPDEFDASVVAWAAESDRAEPALLERIHSGEDLSGPLAL